jgi:hypothetical protein
MPTAAKQPPLPGVPEYQTYDLPPEVAPPPAPAQPQQQIQPPSQQRGELDAPRYGFGKGAKGALAGAAFLAMNALKGYSQGKEALKQKKAMEIKRTTDGLAQAYNMAGKHYLDLYKARLDEGKKPTDPDFMTPEMKQAAAAVDASWAAMMRMIAGQTMDPGMEGGKKKKKGQAGGQQDDQQNPLAGLQSQDPQERVRAWLYLATKAGPDVYHQASEMSSERATAERQYGTTATQNLAQVEQAKQERNKLLMKDRSQMSPEDIKKDDARIAQLEQMTAAGGTGGTKLFAPRFGPQVTAEDLKTAYPNGIPTATGVVDPPPGSVWKEVIYGDRDGQPLIRFEPATPSKQLKVQAGPTGEPILTTYNPATGKWVETIGRVAQKNQYIMVPGRDEQGNPVQRLYSFTPQWKHKYAEPIGGFKPDQPVDTGSEGSITRGAQFYDPAEIPQPVAGVTNQANTEKVSAMRAKGYPLVNNQLPAGMLAIPTIDLNNRPIIKNDDGTISSERSFSREVDGQEVLVPKIVDGKEVSENEAWGHYIRTGQHLGVFDNAANADAYAEQIHSRPMKEKPSAGTPANVPPVSKLSVPPGDDYTGQLAEQQGVPGHLVATFSKYSKPNQDRANAISAQLLTLEGKPGTADIGFERSIYEALKSPQDVENLPIAMRQLEALTKSQATAAGSQDGLGWVSLLEDTWSKIPAVSQAYGKLTPAGRTYLAMYFRAWTNAALIRSLQGGSGRPTQAMYAILANELPSVGVNVHKPGDVPRFLDPLYNDVATAQGRLPQDMQDQLRQQFPKRPEPPPPETKHQARPPGDSEDPKQVIDRLIKRHAPGTSEPAPGPAQ